MQGIAEKKTLSDMGRIIHNNKEVVDLRDGMANVTLFKKSPMKRDQDILPYLIVGVGYVPGGSVPTAIQTETLMKMSENELIRMVGFTPVQEEGIRKVYAENGKQVDILLNKSFYTDEEKNVLYVSLVQKPKFYSPSNAAEWEAYNLSTNMVRKGTQYAGKEYEHAFSSTSQTASGKCVFVRRDFRIPAKLMENITSPYKRKKYEDARGAVALLIMASYGAWLDWEGKMLNPAKINARIGLPLSSSKSIPIDMKVRIMGSLKMLYSEELDSMLWDQMLEDGVPPEKAKVTLERIKKHWKPEKCDGYSIIRLETIKDAFLQMGIKMKNEDLIGCLLQIRYAGFKGTVLVVPGEILDGCVFPDGTHGYRGFDMIVEEASWKYNYDAEVFCGENAPSLCLVSMSKNKSSQNMFSMLWNALDGTKGDAYKLFKAMSTLSDETFTKLKACIKDPALAKEWAGIMAWNEGEDDFGLNEMRSRMTSPIFGAIDAHGASIRDKSVSTKFLNKQLGIVEDRWSGRMPIEGATRFVITDPSMFFRTDMAVDTGRVDMFGNKMWDIEITSPEQLVLDDPKHCYWGNRDKPALLFRSPCVHHGEPQTVQLVSLDRQLLLPQLDGTDVDLGPLFQYMNKLLVVNACSYILEALGGAESYWLPM